MEAARPRCYAKEWDDEMSGGVGFHCGWCAEKVARCLRRSFAGKEKVKELTRLAQDEQA